MEQRGALLIAAGAVALFYLVLFALAPAHLPALISDGGDYLGVGRWLAGAGRTPQLVSSYHAFGYGIPLAIPYLLTTNATTVYRCAVGLNVLAGVALLFPLRALGRDVLGLGPRSAIAAGVAGTAYAGVALQVGEVLPTVVLALGLAWFAVLEFRVLRAPSVRDAVLLCGVAVVVFALHHRTAPALGVAVLTLVMLAAAGDNRAAVWGGAVAVVGLGAVLVVDRLTVHALYPLGTGELGVARAVREVDIGTTFRVLVGELWYVAVATLGLAVIGVLTLARTGARGASRAAVLYALAAFGTAVLGALQIAGAATLQPGRLDFLAYGRYVDPYVPVLATAGVAGLLRRSERLPAVAALAVLGATAVEVIVQGAETLDGEYQKASLPAVLGASSLFGARHAPFGADLTLVGIALVAFLAAGSLVLIGRHRRRLAAGVAVLMLAVLGALGATGSLRSYYRFTDRAYADLPRRLADVPSAQPVGFLPSGETIVPLQRLQFLEPWRRIDLVTEADLRDRRVPRVLVAPLAFSEAARLQASRIAITRVRGAVPQAVYDIPARLSGAR